MKRSETLEELIKRYGTVRDFGDFLESRGFGRANTWDKIFEDIVRPALKRNSLSEQALFAYLRDVEEYGKQHVFLFERRIKGPVVPTAQHIRVWLRDHDAEDVLETPKVIDFPDAPEVVEVRRDDFDPGEVLVIKIVETRTFDRLLKTTELREGRFYSKEYEREVDRGVNIVRVHPTGLVEIRVFQRRGGSAHYHEELSTVLALLDGLIDATTLDPRSLVKAKKKLYDDRHALAGVVSFSGTAIRDSDGVNHTSACKRQTNLFAFDKTEKSVAALTEDGEAYHDSLNVYWLKQEKKRPKADVHVLMSGEPNEFAIPHQCSRGDYEHVLREILKYNK